MKKILLVLAAIALLGGALTQGATAQTAPAQVITTENYYKAIPGHQQEFLALFMKNHWPLLEEGLKSGRLLSVKIETPGAYMPEDVRWDYRVTSRSLASAPNGADQEAAIKLRLWPDQDTFKKEEKLRFDAVLAHWDITVTDLTPASAKR